MVLARLVSVQLDAGPGGVLRTLQPVQGDWESWRGDPCGSPIWTQLVLPGIERADRL